MTSYSIVREVNPGRDPLCPCENGTGTRWICPLLKVLQEKPYDNNRNEVLIHVTWKHYKWKKPITKTMYSMTLFTWNALNKETYRQKVIRRLPQAGELGGRKAGTLTSAGFLLKMFSNGLWWQLYNSINSLKTADFIPFFKKHYDGEIPLCSPNT